MTPIKPILIALLLSSCDYTIGVPLTTPVERAAGEYIGCANYWRLHPEQKKDMDDLSAFIGCPKGKGSHCLCADWEGKARQQFEDDARDSAI